MSRRSLRAAASGVPTLLMLVTASGYQAHQWQASRGGLAPRLAHAPTSRHPSQPSLGHPPHQHVRPLQEQSWVAVPLSPTSAPSTGAPLFAAPEGPDEEVCSGRRPLDAPPFRRRVALTFDDGPSQETTAKIVAQLRARDWPATFFFNGSKVATSEDEALVRAVAEDPNIIVGNHGWSHDNLALKSATELASEIDNTSVLLTSLGASPRFFRFPFGRASCDGRAAVLARNLRSTGWHVSSADWCFAERDGWCPPWRYRYVPEALRHDMVGFVMRQLKRKQGGIVLLHDGLPYTVSKLPELFQALEEGGYRVVRLDNPTVFPKLNAPGPIAGVRRVPSSRAREVSDRFATQDR